MASQFVSIAKAAIQCTIKKWISKQGIKALFVSNLNAEKN